MAEYKKVFDNPYPDGWQNLPNETTPITAEALQEHTDAIENIEDYLEKNPIDGGGGVSFEVGNELELEDEVLRYKANYGTSGDFEEFKRKSNVPIGATYHVTDDYIEGGGSSEIYDDTERVIGTWFGKPLYQKTYIYNETMSGSVNKPHYLSNVNFVEVKTLATSNASINFSLPYVHPDVAYNTGLFLSNENISLRISSVITLVKLIVTLRYTKVGD